MQTPIIFPIKYKKLSFFLLLIIIVTKYKKETSLLSRNGKES